MYNFQRVILCAGHGGDDSGAVHLNFKEADQTIYLVDKIANFLKISGLTVDVVPHNLNLTDSINWINTRQRNNMEVLSVEIHRDSATGLNFDDASTRCGVYFETGNNKSRDFALNIQKGFLEKTSNKNCWARPDNVASKGRLGWIQDITTFTSLLELGFMQGKNTLEHLDWLAKITAEILFKTITGD